MATIAMLIDLDRCVGCFACQNACKVVNQLLPGVQWLKVTPREAKPEEVDGKLVMDRFPVPVSLEKCGQCPDRTKDKQPLCATVCMGKAVYVGDPETAVQLAKKKRAVLFTR